MTFATFFILLLFLPQIRAYSCPCRVDRNSKDKIRPIMIKLKNQTAKKRCFRNLKIVCNGEETNIYISSDKTKIKLETYKRLRKEIKLKGSKAKKTTLTNSML